MSREVEHLKGNGIVTLGEELGLPICLSRHGAKDEGEEGHLVHGEWKDQEGQG